MSENRTKNYEMKCLLELLSSIVNVEPVPRWRRKPAWGEIYKLADYHNVANYVYYGILPLEDEALTVWKSKFEERFHSSVLSDERYTTMMPELIKGLAEQKIHFMILKDYQMREYYPQKDMRSLEAVEILVEKGQLDKIKLAMYWLDFEEKEVRDETGFCFYKIPGMWVIFREELQFTNKKMRKYFALSPKDYTKADGLKYLHIREPEENYIYVMSCLAEWYARGRLDIQDMLDIWQYYFKVYRHLNWDYIGKEFDRLDIKNFTESIIKLAAFWFGKMVFPENDELFSAMEKYILTKGIQGRLESSKLLPLVKEVADFYKRDMRRERMQRMISWVFPDMNYMDTLFPILKKWKKLIPLCWGLRLIYCGVRMVETRAAELKRKFIAKRDVIWIPVKEKTKAIARTVKRKVSVFTTGINNKCKRLFHNVKKPFIWLAKKITTNKD